MSKNEINERNEKNKRKTKGIKEKQIHYNHQNLDRYQKRLKKHLSKQSELDDRNARIVNKTGDKSIREMNYRNYDNEHFEEDKNNSFNENLLDLKEGRIHDDNNKTLENQYYNRNDIESNSLQEDINQMVDRM